MQKTLFTGLEGRQATLGNYKVERTKEAQQSKTTKIGSKPTPE